MHEISIINKVFFFLLACQTTIWADPNKPDGAILIFHGISDASAAAAISEDMFIVGDDENNILRVYKITQPALPVFSYDLTNFLGVEAEHPEADIEGATIVGDRIYWITSHGRNKDGKMRPNRYRFFATAIKVEGGNVNIQPVGVPCKRLVHKLIENESMQRLGLNRAAGFNTAGLSKKERQNLAPKREGLNIEGLCASADGQKLYIGFRNPRPYNSTTRRAEALVVPLNNPAEVVEKGQSPVFGEPIIWDLGGLGIRDMEYSYFHKAYFIIAGPHDEKRKFALYKWSGKEDVQPVLIREIFSESKDFSPEAIVTFRNRPELLLLSDDGTLIINISNASECMEGRLRNDGKCLNKYLADQNKKYFRGIWLKP